MLNAALADPLSLEVEIASALKLAPATRFPLFHAESISAALYSPDGCMLCATPVFLSSDGALHVDTQLVIRAAQSPTPLMASITAEVPGGRQNPAIIAYAAIAQTKDWQVPEMFATAVVANPAGVLVVTSLGSIDSHLLQTACRAFGLTELETRVAIAVVRSGSIRAAADLIAIAYQTAREVMASAMKRTGVSRLPALISRLSTTAFGVLPDGDDGAGLLTDIWAVTPRQANIGALVCEGLSRGEIALALGISEAVVKKELNRLYLTLGVESSAALARVLAEANAMQWVIRATGGSLGFIESQREPLRFAIRPDNTRIAWSDYGPSNGRPVLVVHSSMTTRFVSRRLLRALHAKGFRPIAIDRPGFGLTDPIAGCVAGAHDPFDAAVDDVAIVVEQAKIRRIDIVSRGAAQHVMALGRRLPHLLRRVVIINPDPDSLSDPRRHGPLGAVKEAFIRRPTLVRTMGKVLASQMIDDKPYRIVARSLEGSLPDEIGIAQTDILEDYVRSLRPFGTGRLEGYVNEQMAHATLGKIPPLTHTPDWHLLIGSHDTLSDPAFVLSYWRNILPNASFTKVADAGRLLAMTHADRVAATLACP